MNKTKNKNKQKIPNAVLDQILNEKDLSENISKSDISETISEKHLHIMNMNKLKTIEEEIGNTLTINKETIEL